MGLQAYSVDHSVDWQHQWYEPAPGALVGRARSISKELAEAATKVGTLVAEAERKRAEARRKWEAEREEERRREEILREEARRQDIENRRRLEEKRRHDELVRRQKEFVESVGQWRLAQDIREYVWATHALIADANMTFVEGSPLAEDLKWALEHADEIDPHTAIREDIAHVRKAYRGRCVCPSAVWLAASSTATARATEDRFQGDPSANRRAAGGEPTCE